MGRHTVPRHLLLVLLACLASQLLVPQATAQSTTTYTEDPLAMTQSTADSTIYSTDESFTVLAGSCPAGFGAYPICAHKQQEQCQGSCCFDAGFCTSSTANNCVNTPDSFFPPTPGTEMKNHNSDDFNDDGCMCDQSLTMYDGNTRRECFQVSGSNKCWGIITCDTSDHSNTCIDENGGFCTVRQSG